MTFKADQNNIVLIIAFFFSNEVRCTTAYKSVCMYAHICKSLRIFNWTINNPPIRLYLLISSFIMTLIFYAKVIEKFLHRFSRLFMKKTAQVWHFAFLKLCWRSVISALHRRRNCWRLCIQELYQVQGDNYFWKAKFCLCKFEDLHKSKVSISQGDILVKSSWISG